MKTEGVYLLLEIGMLVGFFAILITIMVNVREINQKLGKQPKKEEDSVGN